MADSRRHIPSFRGPEASRFCPYQIRQGRVGTTWLFGFALMCELPSVATARPAKSLPGEEGVAGETSAAHKSASGQKVSGKGEGEGKAESGDSAEVSRHPPIPTATPNAPRSKNLANKVLPKELDVRITGSLSMSTSIKTWPDDDGSGAEGFGVSFERVSVGLDGSYKGFLVSTDYRFYGKYGTLHHGYLGYRHGDVFEFDVGVHRVPFGILPYASHNW
ncbi:MAG: hypothetical protein ACPG4T_13725, partial [Nannocystaceae bacterium]